MVLSDRGLGMTMLGSHRIGFMHVKRTDQKQLLTWSSSCLTVGENFVDVPAPATLFGPRKDDLKSVHHSLMNVVVFFKINYSI